MILIKHTLIGSTKSTVSVVAVCYKMKPEPVFVADNWRRYIHSRQPDGENKHKNLAGLEETRRNYVHIQEGHAFSKGFQKGFNLYLRWLR